MNSRQCLDGLFSEKQLKNLFVNLLHLEIYLVAI